VSPLPRRRGRQRGQALVEFGLIFPILVLLMVAAIDIGRGVFAYNSVTNAAREGARLAIVNQDANLILQRAIKETQIAETASPNIRVTFWKQSSTPNAAALNGDCTSGFGCQVLVRYETTFRPITPIISRILFPNGVTLVATSIEYVEFTCPNASTTAANCPKQP
jgi:Flp pilus assembly protein TadG